MILYSIFAVDSRFTGEVVKALEGVRSGSFQPEDARCYTSRPKRCWEAGTPTNRSNPVILREECSRCWEPDCNGACR
jgi:hypothetical protein